MRSFEGSCRLYVQAAAVLLAASIAIAVSHAEALLQPADGATQVCCLPPAATGRFPTDLD
jgi:hypothetical protein